MSRLARFTAAVSLAVVPFVWGAGPAAAATGLFFLTDPDGTQHILVNPISDACNDNNGKGLARNGTDQVAELYVGRNCQGGVAERLAPGRADPHATYGSLRFLD